MIKKRYKFWVQFEEIEVRNETLETSFERAWRYMNDVAELECKTIQIRSLKKESAYIIGINYWNHKLTYCIIEE